MRLSCFARVDKIPHYLIYYIKAKHDVPVNGKRNEDINMIVYTMNGKFSREIKVSNIKGQFKRMATQRRIFNNRLILLWSEKGLEYYPTYSIIFK